MTIAAGILCEDGMVLCADTEETIAEGRKAQASKLRVWRMVYPFESDEQLDLTIGFAGAGHSDWIAAFIQGMDHDVLEDVPEDFGIDKFEELLERYTEDFFVKYIRAYAQNPEHRPQAYMLVLAQFCDRRAIYRVHENLVLKAEEESSLAVGVGAPVFQHLMKSLLGNCTAYRPAWKIREVASVAVYILDKVKSEVPGCGGNSHIVMIRKDGEEKHIPTQKIKELEIHHAAVEAKLYGELAQALVKKLP